jgi:hypothetical protein
MRLYDLDKLDQARLAEVARLVSGPATPDDLRDARLMLSVLMRRMGRDDRNAARIVGRLVESASDRRGLLALALRMIIGARMVA